jgi:hypothetical protein
MAFIVSCTIATVGGATFMMILGADEIIAE